MTDFDKVKILLGGLGVGFKLNGNDICCCAGEDKVGLYVKFMTVFSFDEKGDFIQMGSCHDYT